MPRRFGFLFDYGYKTCTEFQAKVIFGMENWKRFIVKNGYGGGQL